VVVGLNTLKNRHRFFIYVETHTKKLNVRVVKGRLVSNSKGYRISASERTETQHVAELLKRISEVTNRDTLQEGASGLPQRSCFSREYSTFYPAHRLTGIRKGLCRMTGPTRRRCHRPLEYRPPCSIDVTPSVPRLGAAARGFARCNPSHSS